MFARFSTLSRLAFLALFVAAMGCGRREPRALVSIPVAAAESVRFTDVTAAAGIRFRHTSGASGRLYLPETMGAGGAFLDYDGDGRQDLFLLNGTRLPGFRGKGPFYPALYHNRGGTAAQPGSCRFEEVTRAAGLAFEGY